MLLVLAREDDWGGREGRWIGQGRGGKGRIEMKSTGPCMMINLEN